MLETLLETLKREKTRDFPYPELGHNPPPPLECVKPIG